MPLYGYNPVDLLLGPKVLLLSVLPTTYHLHVPQTREEFKLKKKKRL